MKKEFQAIFKKKMLIATLFAVTILPLIYGALYLWAFWDPYGKLDRIPVAVVNNDICQEKKDKKETYCFGNKVIDKLKENMAMNWQFVDESEAEKGLVGRKYYAQVIIPQDFTQNILSADSDSPTRAAIDFKSRPASNFMASKFTNSAVDKIKASLNQEISKEYIDALFDETRNSVKDLSKAMDGSGELKDGLSDAKNGSKDLYEGTDKANSGVYDLNKGLNDLSDGAVKLANGFDTVQSGKQYSFLDGLTKAHTGVETLDSGLSQYTAGVSKVDTGLGFAVSGVGNLKIGAKAVEDGMGAGMTALNTSQSNLTNAANLLSAYITAHPEASGSAELTQAMAIIQGVNGGLGQMSGQMTALVNGQSQVTMGLTTMETSLGSLKTGTSQLTSMNSQLTAGVKQLDVGMSDAQAGSVTLYNGVISLKDWINQAKDGSKTLLEGMEKLKKGQLDLVEGLGKALNGVSELKDKLAKAVADSRKKTDENKNRIQSEVMSSPVDIHDVSIDIVNNNGTGFAPYFIPLAYWVGAMAIYFLINPNEGKYKNILWSLAAKIGTVGIIGLVQVFILSGVLVRLLGLHPLYLGLFIIFCVLLSWCFLMIQMLLTLVFKDAGKFFSILLLMLQLTTSAGSYPLETVPAFFQKLNPYLPMTYATAGLREVVSGGDIAYFWRQFAIIGSVTLGFVLATFVYGLLSKRWIKMNVPYETTE